MESAVEDTRAWGGPGYRAIEAHLAPIWRRHGAEEPVDLAEVFAAAPEEIRRPVDLLGLLEIAHDAG